MKIDTKPFRVREGGRVSLDKRPTLVASIYQNKRDYKTILAEHVGALSKLQRQHYASNNYALLLIFQAMDAAGKDGAIGHVMSGVNPQGCQVFSFKHPSASELAARLPVAGDRVPARARKDRDLQQVILRGRVDRPGPSRVAPRRRCAWCS
ncbi:hypothetical protein ACRAWG_19235 [Methylobacterium sp. P31]